MRTQPDFTNFGTRPAGEFAFASRSEHGGTVGVTTGRANTPHILPPAAAAKLQRLRDATDDAGSILREVADRRNELLRQRQVLSARIASLTNGRQRTVGTDHPSVTTAQADLAAVNAEVATLDARSKAVQQRRPRILRHLDDYLRTLRHDTPIEPHPPVTPTLARGQTPAEAVEAQRAELRRLGDALDSVRSAPMHSEATKAAIRRQVEALAERGAPDVLRSIELGVPLAFATREVPMVRLHGHAVMPGQPPIAGFTEATTAPDATALLAWLHRGEIIARLEAEVDALSDDSNALTDEEREEQSGTLRDQMLECERMEEACIELAEAGGTEVPRRAEADPRAVLGLPSDLPPPRQ